jgi:hypothetical protein
MRSRAHKTAHGLSPMVVATIRPFIPLRDRSNTWKSRG